MTTPQPLLLAIPKGRMFNGIRDLFAEAGCPFTDPGRNYRVQTNLDGISTKLLKPQSIVEMVNVGRRDLGFAGADWVNELNADLVELLDTGLDPVSIVAAAPESLLVDGTLPDRPLVVASEYARLTEQWMREAGVDGRFVRSWGATEVLPPEDADCIVDNTATGSTLRANRLEIVDTLMQSSTRLYANPRVLDAPASRDRIEALVLVLQSVLDARRRVMVELNVAGDDLDSVLSILPAMRSPTLSALQGNAGSAVKAAVPKSGLADLIPALRKAGATDIVVSRIDQIVA